MVRLLDRLFGSFFSALSYSFFHYHQDHHHHHNATTAKRSKKNYYNMPNKGRPLSLQTVELKVRMCCTGCERVVKEAIQRLRGIDSIDINLKLEKVTVIGYVDRNKVLKAVRRAGKRAEFWPYPNPPLYFTSANHYYKDNKTDYKESYNYWQHGYNAAERHGALPVTSRGDDKVSNMFNDDNVNACCLM